MKKYFLLTLFAFSFIANGQVTANRFFYELTYKPKKGAAETEKVMSVLDIVKDKSIFRDYTMIAQDSILQVKIAEMQKAGVYQDLSKSMKMPKFSYRIEKSYPSMSVQYSEGILNGMSMVNLAYNENSDFKWKILSDTKKIGDYNTQKATSEFGGRTWTAWFSKDIPFQDGPYKFSGLPGLIIQIEDTDQNYSWELKGNKPVQNFEEITSLEKMQSGGGTPKVVLVDRPKFETKFEEYKKDPFGSIRSQIPAEAMMRKMPGSDKTIGEMLKDQEKMMGELYGGNNNPVELSTQKSK